MPESMLLATYLSSLLILITTLEDEVTLCRFRDEETEICGGGGGLSKVPKVVNK